MKKFLFFWKKYEVPTALPSAWFPNVEGEYNWEMWIKDTKKAYPVQYFLRRSVPFWIKVNITMRIQHILYWIRAHTYNRYHVLKLPSKYTDYKWGWLDSPQKMLYANMKIFQEFCEGENGLSELKFQADSTSWEEHCQTPEELEMFKANQKFRQKVYEDAVDLHHWWCLGGRDAEHAASDALHKKVPRGPERQGSPEQKAWLSSYQSLDPRDDEQLIKLISIRHHLWT